MNLVKGLIQKEPALTLSVLNMAAAAICGIIGHPEFSVVLVAVAAAVLGLRSQVVPAGKAQADKVTAATDAATHVARNLTGMTAGALGAVSTEGLVIVSDAVQKTTGVVADLTKAIL